MCNSKAVFAILKCSSILTEVIQAPVIESYLFLVISISVYVEYMVMFNNDMELVLTGQGKQWTGAIWQTLGYFFRKL